MTDNEVLSKPIGWRWEGELARKRRKAGKITVRQNRVPDRDFEALRGAELMKMKCRSVWDHSRGPKPPKMTENPDFFGFPGFLGSKMSETNGRSPYVGAPRVANSTLPRNRRGGPLCLDRI